MSDIIKMQNGQAIDARFKAVDEKFTTVCQDIGKLDRRVEVLEDVKESHSTGLSNHSLILERVEKQIDSIAKNVGSLTKLGYVGLGIVLVVNILFITAVGWVATKL